MSNDYRVNARKTLDDAETRIDWHLAPVFGGRRMAGITTADVRAYTASRLEAGASPASVNRELSLRRRMFRLAVQPVVTFAFVTGWRIKSEVLPLQWRQVDLNAGTVRLGPGKTKDTEGRVIHLTTGLQTLLEAQRAITDEYQRDYGKICPWVFHGNGQRIASFRKAWKSACKLAGCPGRIPHDLRRTAMRNLVRAGVPERVSMQLTGHKTRSVFERYNIVSESDLVEAARKLDVVTMTATLGQPVQSNGIADPENLAQVARL